MNKLAAIYPAAKCAVKITLYFVELNFQKLLKPHMDKT